MKTFKQFLLNPTTPKKSARVAPISNHRQNQIAKLMMRLKQVPKPNLTTRSRDAR
jgi:hypothetical protein